MAGILFKDIALQNDFDKNGFVHISLLNESEVKNLKDYYLSLKNDDIKDCGFHISLENKNIDYINGVFKKLFEVLQPKLNLFLTNFKSFTASYVIKEPGLENIVPPHQDWSFVDEEEFCSATVWVPLVDVNKNNGALGLIRGSHLFFNNPRPSPSPQAKSILSDFIFTIFPYVEIIEMKAGEALIFNNRTIHASPPNTTQAPRIAAGIGITQKNAKLRHYYQLPGPEEMIEIYEVDAPFFKQYNNSSMSKLFDAGKRPEKLKKIGKVKKVVPQLTKDEMKELICSVEGNKVNEELIAELAKLYNYNTEGKKTEMDTTTIVDTPKRTFFQTYTPSNILAEIKYRLSKSSK